MIILSMAVQLVITFKFYLRYCGYFSQIFAIMERSALKSKLRLFFRERGLTQKSLADEMGIQAGNLSDMINGKGRRKIDRLITYLNEHYGGDFELPDDEKSDVHVVESQDVMPYTENNKGTRFFKREDGQILMEVPLVPFNVLGSPDDEFATLVADREDGQMEIFEVDAVHHGEYVSFMVDGDSMDDGTYDGFRRGDIVLVRKLDRQHWLPKLHFKQWPFWVVVFGNCVRLKQIVAQDEKTGNITFHSLNPSPEYTDFTLNLDQIRILYNVVLKKPKQVKYGM